MGLAGLLAFAIIGGGIALSLASQGDVPGDQLRHPITWDDAGGPGAPDASVIDLAADGSAQVAGLVVGDIDIDVDDVDPPCVATRGGTYTGEATWEIDDVGALRVHTTDGSAVLTPDSARFTGDADWTSIRQPFCDASYTDYGVRSACR
ncbi:MAG: hypothetical protein Q8Q19_03670 [Microbacterium sp.]|nr:hypothetical protein [Microbacterium sp.]